MAHSMVMFGDQMGIFNDLDLLVLLGFMTTELRERPGAYPALQPMLSTWSGCRSGYGPGTIDLHLDEIGFTSNGRVQLGELLMAVQQRLDIHGDTIPAERLNAEWPVPGVSFNRYRVKLLEAAMAKLRDLVRVV